MLKMCYTNVTNIIRILKGEDMKQRLFSILLSFIIIFSVNPAAVYAAAEASAEEPAVTEVLSTESIPSERTFDPEYLTGEFKEAYPVAETGYSYDEFDDYTDEYPSFTKVSLVLGGQIGVNFFVKLPYIEDADYNESRVEFKIGDETEPSVVVPINPEEKSANGLFYKFTCPISSIEMGDTITAAYCYKQNGEDYFSEITYSAQQYLTDYMKRVTESEEPDGQPLITNVVKSLADYGYYAQQYLSALRGWTIGEDGAHAAMAAPYTASYSYDEILEDIGETKASVKCSEDITEITSSLVLDSNTELVVYFKPADGYDGPIEIFVEDQRIEQPEQLPDGRCRIYITNIGASRLSSSSYTITAKTAGGEATAVVDVFSYLAALLKANKDDSRVINLVGSMVAYARAAEAYVS